MHSRIKFTEGFKDGNIFPDRSFAPGETAVVTENQLARIASSGGVYEVVEQVIPNPLKAEAQAKKEPADPLNAENSINDLENHIPGLEDEVEDVRLREAQRRADPSVVKKGSESVFNEEPALSEAKARAKVEEAAVERKQALEADLEAGRQEDAKRAEAKVEKERKEYVDAKVEADSKKQGKKK